MILTSIAFGTEEEKDTENTRREQLITNLLDQANIEKSPLRWPSSQWRGKPEKGGVQGEDLEITIDLEQPDFSNKLSQVMDAHKAQICDHYKDVDFIFLKPNGEVLDAQQAAKVIQRRQAILDADSAKLTQLASELGVGRIHQHQPSRSNTGWRSMFDNADPQPTLQLA